MEKRRRGEEKGPAVRALSPPPEENRQAVWLGRPNGGLAVAILFGVRLRRRLRFGVLEVFSDRQLIGHRDGRLEQVHVKLRESNIDMVVGKNVHNLVPDD